MDEDVISIYYPQPLMLHCNRDSQIDVRENWGKLIECSSRLQHNKQNYLTRTHTHVHLHGG